MPLNTTVKHYNHMKHDFPSFWRNYKTKMKEYGFLLHDIVRSRGWAEDVETLTVVSDEAHDYLVTVYGAASKIGPLLINLILRHWDQLYIEEQINNPYHEPPSVTLEFRPDSIVIHAHVSIRLLVEIDSLSFFRNPDSLSKSLVEDFRLIIAAYQKEMILVQALKLSSFSLMIRVSKPTYHEIAKAAEYLNEAGLVSEDV